jgi:hypothetical protein
MGVLVSAGIKKYDLLTGTASETAIEAGVRELNLQETMIWTKMKFSDTGWISDAEVYKAVDKNLGQGYSWNPGPSIGGGTLHYQSQSIVLVRKESQINSIGNWY